MNFVRENSKSIFIKIFAATLSVCAVIIASFAILTYLMLDRTVERNIGKMLEGSAEFFADAADAGISMQQLAETAAKYAESSGIRTTLVRNDGSVIFDSGADKSAMTNHLDRIEIRAAFNGKRSFSKRYSSTLKTKLMYAAIPAEKKSDGTYAICVRQSMPFADMAKSKKMLGAEIAILSFVATVLAAAFSWILARRISVPLKKLCEMSLEVSHGNFDVRPPVSYFAETRVLGESVAAMARTLKKRVNSLYKRNCELDEIFAHMDECVFICSSDGEIRRFNKSCAELFNMPDNTENRTAAEVFRNGAIVATIEKVFAQNASVVSEVEFSENKIYEISGAPLPYESKKGRALFVMRDVSGEKLAERLRREFVAGVSHELKTPITAIRMSAETLSDTETSPEAKRFLPMILKESDRMTSLVNDMLLLSRIEFTENAGCDAFMDFPVRTAIDEAVNSNENEANLKGDKIEISCPENISIVGDFTLVVMALSNLIGNAVKYGGTACHIGIEAKKSGSQTIISVSDTGVGISKENLPRVFERFFRVDKGRSRAQGGTGLGLAIVKHVAILHGGKAEVSSELGKGSTFTITFNDNKNGR